MYLHCRVGLQSFCQLFRLRISDTGAPCVCVCACMCWQVMMVGNCMHGPSRDSCIHGTIRAQRLQVIETLWMISQNH